MVTPYGHYFFMIYDLADSLIADAGQLHARLLYDLDNDNENRHGYEHHLCLIAVIAVFDGNIAE